MGTCSWGTCLPPLAYVGRSYLKRAFSWLMKHKTGFMLGAILVQIVLCYLQNC